MLIFAISDYTESSNLRRLITTRLPRVGAVVAHSGEDNTDLMSVSYLGSHTTSLICQEPHIPHSGSTAPPVAKNRVEVLYIDTENRTQYGLQTQLP